jgi:hypothetical protein
MKSIRQTYTEHAEVCRFGFTGFIKSQKIQKKRAVFAALFLYENSIISTLLMHFLFS